MILPFGMLNNNGRRSPPRGALVLRGLRHTGVRLLPCREPPTWGWMLQNHRGRFPPRRRRSSRKGYRCTSIHRSPAERVFFLLLSFIFLFFTSVIHTAFTLLLTTHGLPPLVRIIFLSKRWWFSALDDNWFPRSCSFLKVRFLKTFSFCP